MIPFPNIAFLRVVSLHDTQRSRHMRSLRFSSENRQSSKNKVFCALAQNFLLFILKHTLLIFVNHFTFLNITISIKKLKVCANFSVKLLASKLLICRVGDSIYL